MISRTSAERVLNAALATGGDFAELYMEDGESHSISMLDGVVENAAYSRARGAGVRILSGTRSAYAYTVDISESALVETAKRASAIIKGEGVACCPSRIYATATTGAGYHSRRWITQSGCTC